MSNWYDDIDAATLQRIKTYSAFCDYKSQNLMLQTLYEAMQKKIDEYKQTNREIAKDFADLRKASKLQWHDLRKDPNDLPNGDRVVLNQVGMATRYDPNRGFLGLDGIGVIAWCEKPKFEETE